MNSKLCKEEDDFGEQPVSPKSKYFNSKALSMGILVILEFEMPMDVDYMVPLVKDIFLPSNPRFSSIMVSNKGVRRWKRVEVNIQDHVEIPSFPEGLTVAEYDVHFDEYLTKVGMEPFPENKPLWSLHFVNYPTSKTAGNIISKLHHSLGDGYSLMGALLSIMKRADDPSLPLTFPSTRQKQEANARSKSIQFCKMVPRTLSFVYHGMRDFGRSLAKTAWNVDDITPVRSGLHGVGFYPAVKISTVAFSIDKLKQIKTKLDVTINSVLTGIIFYGARLYMKETGERFRNSKSTVAVALNTRNINGYMSIQEMLKPNSNLLGNQFTVMHIALPELTNHNASNPLDFVSEAHKMILRKKNSPAVYLTAELLEICRKCQGSETTAKYVKRALQNSSLGFSNMIGPVEKMAVANQTIKGLYYMATGSHMSLTMSAISYMQTLRLGIGAELGFIDSQKFISSIEQAYDQIYVAATSIAK